MTANGIRADDGLIAQQTDLPLRAGPPPTTAARAAATALVGHERQDDGSTTRTKRAPRESAAMKAFLPRSHCVDARGSHVAQVNPDGKAVAQT